MTRDLDAAVHAHLAGSPYAEVRRHGEALLDQDTDRLSVSV